VEHGQPLCNSKLTGFRQNKVNDPAVDDDQISFGSRPALIRTDSTRPALWAAQRKDEQRSQEKNETDLPATYGRTKEL
jgi:hypothetical protein